VSDEFPTPGPDAGPAAPDVDNQLDDLREQATTDATPDRPVRYDAAPEQTGNPAVDAVLESLERLDDTPVSEHVAVFESAHERLRGALADAGEDRPRP
jgi:hypothetical protein